MKKHCLKKLFTPPCIIQQISLWFKYWIQQTAFWLNLYTLLVQQALSLALPVVYDFLEPVLSFAFVFLHSHSTVYSFLSYVSSGSIPSKYVCCLLHKCLLHWTRSVCLSHSGDKHQSNYYKKYSVFHKYMYRMELLHVSFTPPALSLRWPLNRIHSALLSTYSTQTTSHFKLTTPQSPSPFFSTTL